MIKEFNQVQVLLLYMYCCQGHISYHFSLVNASIEMLECVHIPLSLCMLVVHCTKTDSGIAMAI